MTDSGREGDHPGRALLARHRFDWSETPPSVAVVLALADLTPPALSPREGAPLAEYLNPDRLDDLLTHESNAPGTVAFTVGDYRIRIEGENLSVSGPVLDPS